MKIDVKFVKNYYNQIKKINDDYEMNYLNFYNELNQALENWQDDNSAKFSEQIVLDKNDYNKILLDLKQLEFILKNVYEKYEPIAKNIKYVKENKDSLYSFFDQYLNKLVNIIDYIDRMDFSFCRDVGSLILSIKKDLMDNKNKIEVIRSKVKSVVNDIEKKEMEINKILAKLDYKIINEVYYKDYI